MPCRKHACMGARWTSSTPPNPPTHPPCLPALQVYSSGPLAQAEAMLTSLDHLTAARHALARAQVERSGGAGRVQRGVGDGAT